MRFEKPVRQDAERFLAVNGDVLSSHLAVQEKLIKEHEIDPPSIWNADKMDATPGRDCSGQRNRRNYHKRTGGNDAKVDELKNAHLVTMLPRCRRRSLLPELAAHLVKHTKYLTQGAPLSSSFWMAITRTCLSRYFNSSTRME